MAAGILGTGAYLPERLLTNDELAARFNVTPDWIFVRSGIRQRHIAAPEQACSDLAIIAARRALENAAIAPEELGLLIVATATPDFPSPATAALVQHAIGASRAVCYDLSAACTGFVYALVTGCHLVHAGFCSYALVIGSEVLSRVVNPDDPDTAILFGDGAGAAVLGTVPEGYGLQASDMGTDGALFDVAMIPGFGSRNRPTPETVAQGLQYTRLDGFGIFRFVMRVVGDSVMRILTGAGLGIQDVDLFVPHQANRRIVEATANRLNLPVEKIMLNMDQCGNTSAASVAIALHEALVTGRINPGSLVAIFGFGGGMSWGTCLMRWQVGADRRQTTKEKCDDNH